MKREHFLYAVVILSLLTLFSCGKTDNGTDPPPPATEKSCYTFKQTITTSISPTLAGYPKTEIKTYYFCGFTQADADSMKDSLTARIQATIGGYLITTESVCVYTKNLALP